MRKKNDIFKISPNSLNLFLECPACFWLEKRIGIRRPQPYPYSLNTAVDVLLKEEFDFYRKKHGTHPLLKENNIEAKLFQNQALLNQWRNNFNGLTFYDENLNAILFGAVDDILEFEDGSLAPLDYKTTGASVVEVYDRFQLQLDVYTYLLEMNGFKTKRKGFLAFYIVDKENGFNDRLPFKKQIVEVETHPEDIPELFKEAIEVLQQDKMPPHSKDCPFANWFYQVKDYHV